MSEFPAHSASDTTTAKSSPLQIKELVFLSVVMLINALAYGTIIPLLYPYAERFGLGPFGLSLLFVAFSVFQFIFTPIIGRLSDIYGRRPLLLLCILGTGASLLLFAMANAVWLLFVARIIDGITGGNISVAQAVIADKVKGPERAKAFGFLGATFGVGFLLGPAIGGLLSTWFLSAPFWFSGILALIAAAFGYFFLEESLPEAEKKDHNGEPLINFKEMIHALYMPVIGVFLIVNLLMSSSNNAFVIAFQSLTNDVLHMSTRDIGIFFTAIGALNILIQGFLMGKLLKFFPNKPKLLFRTIIISSVLMASLFFARTLFSFSTGVLLYVLASTPMMTVLSGLLSEEAPQDEQGMVLGINQSYTSLGQIIGPLAAGAIAKFSIPSVFIMSAAVYVACFILIGTVYKWRFAYQPKSK